MSRPGLDEHLRCGVQPKCSSAVRLTSSVGGNPFADLDSGVDSWPVVGRSNELRQLAAAMVARRGAVISGPSGVGKTTLAVTGVELAQQRGMSMARATASGVAGPAVRGIGFDAAAGSGR
jgi:hypothetical protein